MDFKKIYKDVSENGQQAENNPVCKGKKKINEFPDFSNRILNY